VVSGPIARELGLNSGAYVLGPGNPANATIGRAISLTLANCMEARVGGVQQGVLGIPSRVGGTVIAEREDTSWEPLHVTRGYPREASTVTAVPHFQGGPQQVVAYPSEYFPSARALASLLATAFAAHNSAMLGKTNLVVISPPMQRRFLADGWTKDDLRRYLLENVRMSLAQFKRQLKVDNLPRTEPIEDAPDGGILLDPADYTRFRYPGLPARDDFALLGDPFKVDDYLIAVAGAEEGEMFAAVFRCYPLAPTAVTKEIRPRAG
jgi:hypothetical protein